MDEDLDLRDFDGRVRLFPLPGVVLFPHAVLPLHIFEPRYREMTRDALASDKLITIVQARPDLVAAATSNGPALEAIACLGRIITHERLPDGRFNLLLHGRKRVRILRELKVGTLYRQAEVEIIEDLPGEPPDDTLKTDLIGLYRDIARRAEGLDPDLDGLLLSNPPLAVITDILAQALGMSASLKQAFLDDPRVASRAEGLTEILRRFAAHLDKEKPPSPAPLPFPPPFSVN